MDSEASTELPNLEASIRKELLQRALAVLAAERERSGEPVMRASIERICALLKLTAPEVLELAMQVDSQGLTQQNSDSWEDDEEEPTSPTENTTTSLIDQMMQHSLLTAEEERNLGRAIRLADLFRDGLKTDTIKPSDDVSNAITRGQQAQRTLILSNVRLVMDIARRYEGRGLALDDLMQEGIIGLMRATNSFDISLGFRFSTYATWWIKQSIMRAVANNGRIVRLPVHITDRLSKIRRATRKIQSRTGLENVKPQLIADELGWSIDKIGELLVLDAQRFITTEFEKDDDDGSVFDRIASPSADPEEITIELDFSRYIRSCLDSLDKRSKDILERRFGLTGESPQTLEQIGDLYQLTRERIRQVESKGIRRIAVKHRDNLEIFLRKEP